MIPHLAARAAEILAQVDRGVYEPGAGYGWWWAWWIWVGGFIILMLIIFLIAYGVRGRDRYTDVPPTDTTTDTHRVTPLEALRAQYERGEISREEYERKKRDLER